MNTPALFDIVPMPADIGELPEPDGLYYVAGRKGYSVMKPTAFGRVLVPVSEIPSLPEHPSTIWTSIPPLPAGLIGQVWSFFRSIYAKRKSEAMVYLTRNKDNVYRVFVPPQGTSGGGVHADLDLTKIQRGWQIVGTIHSHCDFGAFHSGTDTHDADGHDGLHITIGHVNAAQAEFAVMVSFNKVRWDFKLEEITTEAPNLVAHPPWWERYVTDPKPTVTPVTTVARVYPYTGMGWGGAEHHSAYYNTLKNESWFTATSAVRELTRKNKIKNPEDAQELANSMDEWTEDLEALAEELGLEFVFEWREGPIPIFPTANQVALPGVSDAAITAAYKEYMAE